MSDMHENLPPDRCVSCGHQFDPEYQLDDAWGPDCQGCHKCFSCATPDCSVCGDDGEPIEREPVA